MSTNIIKTEMTSIDMIMWKLKMTPGVFIPHYLSFYLAKYQNQGQFWNPQNRQISKLTLLFEFGEVLMEILTKNQLGQKTKTNSYYKVTDRQNLD